MTVSLRAALAALFSLALVACSEAGEPSDTAENPVQDVGENTGAGAFIPADFDVPTQVEAEGFKLVPLGPDLAAIDYAAYMSSIEHLQQTFTRSTSWPTADLTMEDAAKDMDNEAGRFERRESFAYAVLTPDGSRERGCVYVYPGTEETGGEYDAVVRLWVTRAEFDAGFDEELYAWTQGWIAQDWPFTAPAYPGRAMAWEEWDALTAEDGA